MRPKIQTISTGAIALLVGALVAGPAGAAPRAPEEAPEAPAAASVVSTDEATEVEEEESPYSASVTLNTGVGLGTFVSGDQKRELVTAGLSGLMSYKLGDTLDLSSGIGFSWFPVMNYGVGYAPNRTLLGDLSITLSEGRIAKDEELGLNLSGAVTVGLPTSLGSQIQNRLFSLTPGVVLGWSLGDLSLSYRASFSKYFMTSTVPSLDCDVYDDPGLCPEGRGTGPLGAFQTERNGAELFLPSTGINSFTIAHGLSLGYGGLLEGLSLGAALGFGHSFGVVSEAIDNNSSIHAKAGRSQVDSLSTSLSASYVITKKLSAGLSFATSTGQPFGADGKDLVLLDFQRASDNISTIGLSVTGSL